MPALPIEIAGILLVGIVPNPYMTEKDVYKRQQIQNTGKGGYGGRLTEKLDDYIDQAGKLEELTDQLYEGLTPIWGWRITKMRSSVWKKRWLWEGPFRIRWISISITIWPPRIIKAVRPRGP